ncbi:sigma E protease regulator RseP [Arsukibacterium sp.]|uniref:sigma E protease regulator RseP n=1 Tax=Arsukibacterium sp. TaxID=1977258 RepID=UPI00299DEFFC|nr:sigma E protease regulator RseP [Arsukibacterium sp.]MDX1538200.1 sigma E protease regulator RseP [Arsukibacterium sp.]
MAVFLWNAFTFVVALGLLVTVHEFGHFWVARKNGVLVKRFSIGFGKALFSWRDRQGTEFVIAAIPLGGYVRMLDERVDPVLPQFADLAFNHKTVWQRMAIIAAGPAANFIFAIVVLWLMYLIGVQEAKPVIAAVQPQSIVAEAGVQGNEQIISINGHNARDLRSTNLLLVEQLGRPALTLGLQAVESGQQRQVELDLTDWQFNPEQQTVFASLGIELVQPKPTTELAVVLPDSAASRAGLQAGDIIKRINDEQINDWQTLERLIQQNAEQPLQLVVSRAGQSIELVATPELFTREDGFTQGMLGVHPTFTSWPEGMLYTQRYGVVGAVSEGISQTWQLTRLSFAMVAKLLSGDVSVRHLSGPISIAQGAGDTASMGLVAFLAFLALISVNLAVINLLPLPILDGGHLLYLVVELIRGKPVSEKAQEIGFRCGALVLLTLMGIALLNDISRL